jgi:hypothetical protein
VSWPHFALIALWPHLIFPINRRPAMQVTWGGHKLPVEAYTGVPLADGTCTAVLVLPTQHASLYK